MRWEHLKFCIDWKGYFNVINNPIILRWCVSYIPTVCYQRMRMVLRLRECKFALIEKLIPLFLSACCFTNSPCLHVLREHYSFDSSSYPQFLFTISIYIASFSPSFTTTWNWIIRSKSKTRTLYYRQISNFRYEGMQFVSNAPKYGNLNIKNDQNDHTDWLWPITSQVLS